MKDKKILITGGAGMIGSSLTRELIRRGADITVMDIVHPEAVGKTLPSEGFKYVCGDITQLEIVEDLFKTDFEYIFHLAASFANERSLKFPLEDMKTNIEGTINLLSAAARSDVKKFLYASSSCVYGNMSNLPFREDMPAKPSTPYAISKLTGEYYVESFHRHSDLSTVIVRYFNVYGPYEFPTEFRNVTPKFFKAGMRKEPLNITGSGEEMRDFTYVSDAVNATILCAESQKTTGEVFNIGSGNDVSINALADAINEITKNPAGKFYAKRRGWDEILRRKADISALRTIGFEPAVSLGEGLKKTYEWFKNNVEF